MADTLFFGRKYELTIGGTGASGATEATTFVSELGKPAMDIKFDLGYKIGAPISTGHISILGLSKARINSILELAALDPGVARQQHLPIKLVAGYHSAAGTVDIFRGFVVYATVTSPPNMWLNMEVSEVNPRSGIAIDCNVSGEPTVAELIETLIQRANDAGDVSPYQYEFVDQTYGEKCSTNRIANFMGGQTTLQDAVGKLSQQISKFARLMIRGLYVEAYDISADDKDNDIINIDGDHGLLSVSGITNKLATVTTFIQNRPTALKYFNLVSKLNPHANGIYYIPMIEYKGHFAGPEWYVTYYGNNKRTPSND